jgi:hypothetical protein
MDEDRALDGKVILVRPRCESDESLDRLEVSGHYRNFGASGYANAPMIPLDGNVEGAIHEAPM